MRGLQKGSLRSRKPSEFEVVVRGLVLEIEKRNNFEMTKIFLMYISNTFDYIECY